MVVDFSLRSLFVALTFVTAVVAPVYSADPEAAISANDLAGRLSAKQQDGQSLIRLKLENTGAAKSALQLQIKSRSSKAGSDLVYQVLWPKERKGESILLRRSGSRGATGVLFTPPDGVKNLGAAQMDDALFGSALSFEDVIENFFGWEHQAIVGTETVDRVVCQVLESKPGKGDRSTYGSVRAYVDTKRLVPMRVDKFTSNGRLVRRIETTRVVSDDQGRPLPANLVIHGPGDSVTELDGSKIKHDVNFQDAEFTADGLKQLSAPRGE